MLRPAGIVLRAEGEGRLVPHRRGKAAFARHRAVRLQSREALQRQRVDLLEVPGQRQVAVGVEPAVAGVVEAAVEIAQRLPGQFRDDQRIPP